MKSVTVLGRLETTYLPAIIPGIRNSGVALPPFFSTSYPTTNVSYVHKYLNDPTNVQIDLEWVHREHNVHINKWHR